MRLLTAALSIAELTHFHPGRRRASPKCALDNLSLDIAPGEFFVLTGPNGSGKSTLFRILSGLLRPSVGAVHIGGESLFHGQTNPRRQMGMVFQHPALDKHLTVQENLAIHADLYGMDRVLFKKRLAEALAWSDISDRLADRVATLSGGQARQVELVKALLHAPQLLLMDEPTTGLDPGVRLAFLEMVQEIRRKQGMTVFMNSHLFSEAEQADRTGILQNGRMLAIDSPKQLTETLGREMLIVRAKEVAPLIQRITARPEVTLQQRGEELRIWGGNLPELFSEIMAHHRENVVAIAIKQPTLEDVFVHLTGHTQEAASEES